jgi:hypothetical protein
VVAEIDLATTIIPSDHKVWKLFPGEGYKFLRLMSDSNLVFLDIRGLPKLGEDASRWDDDRLANAVSKDRWQRQNATRENPTERRITAVDKATATYVKGLLLVAKKGDLVVVPHEGSSGAISIGQFSTDPNSLEQIDAQDGRKEYSYIGRPVKWLARLYKRDIPLEVLERLQTPVAFFNMGDSGRILFYKSAFNNFCYDGLNYAEFRTQKDVFTSRDNRNLSTWFELIEVLEASLSDGAVASRLKKERLLDIIDSVDIAEEDRADLAININSPGSVIMQAIAQTPLIALALYPMAVQAVPYEQARAATISAKSVSAKKVDCEGSVAVSVRQILNNMGADKWTEACKIAQRASEQSTLTAKSRLKINPKSAKSRR